MQEVKLTHGHTAMVSNKDYGRVSKLTWYAHRCEGRTYARTNVRCGEKFRQVMLHRFILGITNPKIKVDHKDHNGLNCQRRNLRKANNFQNGQNQRVHKNSASRLKGVWWSKWHKKWRAYIRLRGKSIMLGYSSSKLEAARMYDRAARRLFGKFAFTNFRREK